MSQQGSLQATAMHHQPTGNDDGRFHLRLQALSKKKLGKRVWSTRHVPRHSVSSIGQVRSSGTSSLECEKVRAHKWVRGRNWYAQCDSSNAACGRAGAKMKNRGCHKHLSDSLQQRLEPRQQRHLVMPWFSDHRSCTLPFNLLAPLMTKSRRNCFSFVL